MAAYYNEFEPYAAQWLRNLIKAGHIPAGDVDDRSIKDVTPACLAGYGQCHFFAGIGGFGLACRLADTPDDAEIWTAGFPCQPFSVAGRQLAQEDDRHLWPVLSRLIEQKRPAVFIGENVAGIIDLALDGVLFDLEASGYASRAFVVPACAVDAPHRRDRVWIAARSVEHAAGVGRGEGRAEHELRGGRATAASAGVSHGDVGNADGAGSSARSEPTSAMGYGRSAVSAVWANPWAGAEYLPGADGKARRVKSGIRLLSNGVPGRVAKLRAGGNAIVPAVAAEIIKAVMEVRP